MIRANRLLLVLTATAFGFLTITASKEGGNRCSEFNTKYGCNLTCRVRPYNRTTQQMTYEGDILPGVTITDLRIDITSYRKFGMIYRPSLVKISENWCAAMNGSSSHYFKVMFKPFTKYGNVLTPCPLTAGRYYVRDMVLDTSTIPQFVPIGEYRMDYYFYTLMNGKKEFLMLLQDFWDVKPMGTVQF